MKKLRVFDESKQRELSSYSLDEGRLVPDKKFVARHAAVAGRAASGHYETAAEYPNGGKDVVWVVDTPAEPAREAYDEYEDIFVFVPFTELERADALRQKRVPLLDAFDKWEKAVLRGRERDDPAVTAWFFALLDLEAAAFSCIPERVRYYFPA